MADSVDDFLAHYGVKGMRWGQRKIDRTIAKIEKSRTKEYKDLKNRLATNETRFSKMTVPELKAERSRLQGKIKRLQKYDPDWRAQIAGAKSTKSSKLAKKLNDKTGIKEDSAYSLLTSKERMKMYSLNNHSDKNRAIRSSLIAGSVALGAYWSATAGLMKVMGGSPKLQREGRVAAALVLGTIVGKMVVSDIATAQTGRHSVDVHEINRELKARGVETYKDKAQQNLLGE